MARVLVTRILPDGGLDPLVARGHDVVQRGDDSAYTHDELVAAVADVDAVVCLLTDRIDEAVLAAGAAGRLQVVANVAVGYDNIDVVAAHKEGVQVCNTPGVLDETTADLAFLLILAASRLGWDAEHDLRAGVWEGWGITQYLGHDVHGAVLGLVGYGRIGAAVARRAGGFGMRVLHHTRGDTGLPGYVSSLDALLAEADVVSLHVPLNDSTRHLIGRPRAGAHEPPRRAREHGAGTGGRRGGTGRRPPRGDHLRRRARRLRARAVGPPPPSRRPPDGAAPPHRQCHAGHAGQDGADGL